MSKINLNFFGEKLTIKKPKNISDLRAQISQLFCFSPQDAQEILLTYNDNGDKVIIGNDEDLKAFLNSKIDTIDLDISQNSKIYKDNLNQLQEETLRDQKVLEELINHGNELDKLKETKFASERKEIKELQAKINELSLKKCQIRKKILEGVKQIENEKRENKKKIEELQKKMGILPKPSKKPEIKKVCMKKMIPINHKMIGFAQPLKTYQNFYPKRALQHPRRQLGVKFGNTEYIDIPKDTEKIENKEEDIKMRTIDEWGKCLLNKTQEITNKLAEKFKGFPTLNISLNTEEDKKEKKVKEVHFCVTCDGCGMRPIIGNRYKCKGCGNFDFCEKCYEKNKVTHGHEFELIEKSVRKNPFLHKTAHRINPFFRHHSKNQLFPGIKLKSARIERPPKKMEHCPTMGNIFEKEKIANKIVHFGVKCDGCGSFPIIGCRFKCAVCNNFDYCEQCEKKFSEKHNHPFLKIYEPKMNPLYFKCFK